jgi:uncharacterized protein
MMDELVFHDYNGMQLKNAVAIIGFPSLGLVSSIATSFLAKELKLDLIGAITSPSFPAYAIIQNGIPMPPVRFYGGCRDCFDDHGIDCEDLVVITSEFVPKPDQLSDMADMIIDWCIKNDVKTVITLDGIPLFEPDNYSIIGVGSTEAARKMMKDYNITSFDEGMVRGLSGMLLVKAADEDVNVITLLGSAKSDMPDPRGAAKLMEPLSRMLPELKLDTAPLYTEAEEMDKRINSQQSYDGQDRVLYG